MLRQSVAVAGGRPAIAGLVPTGNLSQTTHGLNSTAVAFRTARLSDAPRIWRLVRDSSVLEPNSVYCYLLLCRDFGDTCVVASQGQEICGFVTAYRPPQRSDTVFVWQIGVARSARRQGLAKRLLHALVSLPACSGVRFLEATVTPSNAASQRLFRSFAQDRDAPCRLEPGFSADMFSDSTHDPRLQQGAASPEEIHETHEAEELFRIGPFTNSLQENQPT